MGGPTTTADRAFESLRMVLDAGVDVTVRTTVDPTVMSDDDVHELTDTLFDLGVREHVLQQVRSEGTTPEYRAALAARRTFAATAGDQVEMLDLGADVLAFRRGPVTVVVNCGTEPVDLPAGDVLIASAAVDTALPPDTGVWLT